jgi:putative membrane protein
MSQNKIVVSLVGFAVASAMFVPQAVLAKPPAQASAAATAAVLTKGDQKIVADMAIANMAEVDAGKMAVGKTQNPQVKTFAQKMIDDHTKALNDVTALAQSKGVTLPTEVDAPHKAMAAKLDKLSGDAFDKAYMADAGVSDHSKVHAKLKGFESKAKDPEVKALAAKMLPTVEEHLHLAKDMHGAKAGKAK